MSVGRPGNKKSDIFKHYIEDVSTGCWEWQLSLKVKTEYGQFSFENKGHSAHRIAYEVANKVKLSSDECVCHSCDNRKCINPDHLFIGTRKDNKDDCVNKGRHSRGEKVNTAKLTEKEVLEIRKRCKNKIKGIKLLDIAKEYNITYESLRNIVVKNTWKHI